MRVDSFICRSYSVSKIYKKMEADVMETYRNAEANETLENNKRKYVGDQGAATGEVKAQKNYPREQLDKK